MSDIQIYLDEENTLSFGVKVQGASTKNIQPRFVIETSDGMDISFDGKFDGDDVKVKMPILATTLEPDTYKCRLEMILEGEKYFVPVETTIDAILPVKVRAGIEGNKKDQKKQVTGTVIVKEDDIKVERTPSVPTVEEKEETPAFETVEKVNFYNEKNNLVEIETKNHQFEIKALKEDGSFEGYGSIFGNVDSYGDVVVKGAFKKTLQNRKNVKLLWQHDSREPIGVFTEMFEDNTGLVVKGQIAMDVQKGKEAYSLMKMGAIDGLSIGYTTIRAENNRKDNTRHLKELKLFEVSVVTFPANEEATVTGVKSETNADTADEIAVLDLLKSLQSKSAPIDNDHPQDFDADEHTDTPIDNDHLLEQLVKELKR